MTLQIFASIKRTYIGIQIWVWQSKFRIFESSVFRSWNFLAQDCFDVLMIFFDNLLSIVVFLAVKMFWLHRWIFKRHTLKTSIFQFLAPFSNDSRLKYDSEIKNQGRNFGLEVKKVVEKNRQNTEAILG